jgi:hypothetical protein
MIEALVTLPDQAALVPGVVRRGAWSVGATDCQSIDTIGKRLEGRRIVTTGVATLKDDGTSIAGEVFPFRHKIM